MDTTQLELSGALLKKRFWSKLRTQTKNLDFKVQDIIDFQSDREHEETKLQAQGYVG